MFCFYVKLLRVSGPFCEKKYVVSKIKDFVVVLYYASLIPVHMFLVVIHLSIYVPCNPVHCGPGSSVGIATELLAARSGIESRWERDFPPVHTGLEGHPASCKMGTGSFPGVKCGRGVLLTTHPLLVPWSWKSRAIPLPTLWTTPGL